MRRYLTAAATGLGPSGLAVLESRDKSTIARSIARGRQLARAAAEAGALGEPPGEAEEAAA